MGATTKRLWKYVRWINDSFEGGWYTDFFDNYLTTSANTSAHIGKIDARKEQYLVVKEYEKTGEQHPLFAGFQ